MIIQIKGIETSSGIRLNRSSSIISISSEIRIIMIQIIDLLNLFSTSMNWLGEHEPRSRITRRESLSTSIRVDREEVRFIIKEVAEIDANIGSL